MDLETLTVELGVRRGDVRGLVTALDREGYMHASRMRLTLQGFVLGRALEGMALPPIRRAAPARRAIAAA